MSLGCHGYLTLQLDTQTHTHTQIYESICKCIVKLEKATVKKKKEEQAMKAFVDKAKLCITHKRKGDYTKHHYATGFKM